MRDVNRLIKAAPIKKAPSGMADKSVLAPVDNMMSLLDPITVGESENAVREAIRQKTVIRKTKSVGP